LIKYEKLLSKFKDGAISGILSSLTTTISNIFFTTAKHVISVIRQSYVSIVQAAKILFINPDNLPFGERLRDVAKILAVGASVVVGVLIDEAITKIGLGTIPIIGSIVPLFCGSLVTGLMSCIFLYYFDRNTVIKKLIDWLNNFPSIDNELNYYRNQAIYFENYAASLINIDINRFHEETNIYSSLAIQLDNIKTDLELNRHLKIACEKIGHTIPWVGSFDSFMNEKNSCLVFK
jgi:hypothetical protein